MQNKSTDKKVKIKLHNDGIIINVKVIPGSSRSEIADIIDDVIKIKLNSPPVEGKANKECIVLLSKLLKVPKTSFAIISGEKNKNKTIFIKGNPKLLENIVNALLEKFL